jgi:O-antigen ligase
MLAIRYSYALGILGFALSWMAYDHYRPWVNFHSEAMSLVGVWFLVLSRSLSAKTGEFVGPRFIGWVMAFALLPWMQYAFGISLFAGDALLASLYLCGLSAAICLGYSYAVALPDRDAALTPVFYVVWIVALASAAIGLLQWLNLQEFLAMYVVQADAGDRAMGNLGQPNQLATLLLMGMAALAWTFEQRRIGRTGLIAGITFMSMVLVLTQSRAGMLGGLVGGIFLISKNYTKSRRITPVSIVIWLAAYGLVVQLLPLIHEILLLSDARSVSFGDNARITIWKQMLSGISQAPWVGYGWNQTPTAHAAGSIEVPFSMTYTNAHNVVLDIVAWVGIPLGLLLTGACLYWFLSRMFAIKETNAVYAMACLLPIAVHSMVEYPFAYAYFLLAAGLMVGGVEGAYPIRKTMTLSRLWVGGLLALWGVLGSYMVYEYLLIEEDFRIVRFENLRIGQTPTEYEVPHVWMLSHMASMLKAARQQAAPGMSAAEVENLRKASLRFPYGSLSLRYALALGLNGDPAGASRQMAIIRGMYGDHYYQAAVSVMRELQREKYPELAQVIAP